MRLPVRHPYLNRYERISGGVFEKSAVERKGERFGQVHECTALEIRGTGSVQR